MSATFNRKRIRWKIQVAHDNDSVEDTLTSTVAHLWRGVDVDFEFGFFLGDEVVDVTEYASVTMMVKPTRTDASVMLQTMTTFDSTLTPETWDDGSQQHCVARFAGADTKPTISAKTTFEVWLICLTSIPTEITFPKIELEIEDDGSDTGTTPPVSGDPGYYNKTEVAALIAAARIDTAHVYNQTTGLWVPTQLAGAAGQERWVFGTGHS